MKFNDAHLHIGDYENVCNILKNTPYLNKYKLYTALNPENVKNQELYLSKFNDFFAIPIIFKEISIKRENRYVRDFCNRFNKGVPVTLIDKNDYFSENFDYALMKEHFLLHNADDYKSRNLYYEYLNQNNGFLILHCKDKIRENYIRTLRNNFPNMNIIVAHLGRNTVENYYDIYRILSEFKLDSKIYFDISTIHSIDNIILAIKMVGQDRVLYGSDFPYEYNEIEEMKRREKIELSLMNNFEILNKIGDTNFEKIKTLSRIKKC